MHLVIQCRRGVSLIEVVIVIGVLAIVGALLMPLVQAGREAARRTQCANQRREIGLGILQFEGAKNHLPGNGGWDGRQTIEAKDGSRLAVRTYDIWTKQTFHWGVGDPARGGADQTGSWAFQILPHLDRGEQYRGRAWMNPVATYACPTRRQAEAKLAADDQWANYFGGGWEWAKTDYAANEFVVLPRPRNMFREQITDGLAQTVLAGEKAMHMPGYSSGSWYWDEPFFLGGSGGTARSGNVVLLDADATDITIQRNWGSAHAAGANFLFADGSVRLLKHGTDSITLAALLTPKSRDFPGEF